MCAQFLVQIGAEHDVAVLAAFALVDMHHHASRVDIGEFEGCALGAPHASAIEGHENGAIEGGRRKGGVGKTTVAVNLAVALVKLGYRVGLLDADIYGPNVPMMLGQTRQPSIVDGDRIGPLLAHGVKFISVGLISPGDKPMVMRGPMRSEEHTSE